MLELHPRVCHELLLGFTLCVFRRRGRYKKGGGGYSAPVPVKLTGLSLSVAKVRIEAL